MDANESIVYDGDGSFNKKFEELKSPNNHGDMVAESC